MRFIFLYMIILLCTYDGISQAKTELAPVKNENTDLQIIYINGSAEFQHIIEFENMTETDLYNAMNQWIIESFNNSGAVVKARIEDKLIQIEGIEPGIVLFNFPRSTARLKYVLNLETENNRLCFTIHNMKLLTELNTYTLETYNYNKYGSEIINKQTRKVKAHAIKVANVLVNALNTFFVANDISRKWD